MIIFYIIVYLVVAFVSTVCFSILLKEEDKRLMAVLGLIWPLSVLCFIATHSLKGVGNVFNAITNFMEKKL